MYSRIGDQAHNRQLAAFTQTTQSRMRETQVAISTGKAAQSYSKINDQSALLISARHERSATTSHITQNETGIDRLRAMDGALGNTNNILDRVRGLVVQRISGPVGSSVPLDIEIGMMLEEITGQLNIKLDNRHLFSGSKTDTPPVELPNLINSGADLANAYKGDETILTIRADDSVTIDVALTAADILPVMETLADIKAAHIAGDEAGLQTGLDLLDGHLSDVANLRGAVGTRMTRLESVTESQRDSLAYLGDVISRIEDTDLPEAITLLAQDRTSLEASYLTISQISQLSLADFLR